MVYSQHLDMFRQGRHASLYMLPGAVCEQSGNLNRSWMAYFHALLACFYSANIACHSPSYDN